MSDVVRVALIAAVPATIGAIGVFVIGLLTYSQSKKNHEQGEAIHVLVNSNLTSVKADLAIALARVTKLESLITDLRQTRILGRD